VCGSPPAFAVARSSALGLTTALKVLAALTKESLVKLEQVVRDETKVTTGATELAEPYK
jgi:hypothetical protein